MSASSLLILLKLRYRLLWAHVRSPNGRILLTTVSLLWVGLASLLATLLGAAAGAASGKQAALAARIALSVIYVGASAGAVLLGIGVIPVFSDEALRRYPLSRVGRLIGGQLTACLEPLWLIALALAIGLAAGVSTSGTRGWLGIVAAVLLVGTGSLLASIARRVVDLVLSRPGGPLIVFVAGMGLVFVTPLGLVRLARGDGESALGSVLLAVTPSFLAARAMTAPRISGALIGVALLGVWILLLSGLLLAAKRVSGRSWTSARTGSWSREHPCDTIARLFSRRTAPLAAKMLRYYVRSPQVRYNYPLVLPVVALVMKTLGGETPSFLFLLGAAPAAAFLGTGSLSMNFFGFDGHGFRRYFLLPLPARDVFRTAALVSLIPGAVLIVVGLLAWFMLSEVRPDVTDAAMLLGVAVGGLLLFDSLGLWATILAPRRIAFDATFGNRLSPLANALLICAMLTLFLLPMALTKLDLDAVRRDWWIAPCLVTLGVVSYAATLRLGSLALIARRERMLKLIEQ
jgi:hypothetical protein